MKLGIDWVSLAILAAAYVFSRIPGVNARLGNSAMAAACGVVAYRYYERGTAIQFNLVMLGVAIALALYYVFRAVSGAGTKKPPKTDDE